MDARRLIAPKLALCAMAASAMAGGVAAQEDDIEAGAKLYVAQCKICHGSVSAPDQGQAAGIPPRWRFARLTEQHGGAATRTDASSATQGDPRPHGEPSDLLAFAPPFGPHLRGVYGREAGSVEGYQYSSTFMKTLKGMEWNDAALNVWITDTQSWVPGVYMFYKQRDPEVRRKIIEYLKAAR